MVLLSSAKRGALMNNIKLTVLTALIVLFSSYVFAAQWKW